jgi:hypothetical protein
MGYERNLCLRELVGDFGRFLHTYDTYTPLGAKRTVPLFKNHVHSVGFALLCVTHPRCRIPEPLFWS